MWVSRKNYDIAIAKAQYQGWQHCLLSIRASLRIYPEGGGDIEIMQSIKDIVNFEKIKYCVERIYSERHTANDKTNW